MQQQGPNGMGGPLRGSSVWWHGRGGPLAEVASPEPRPKSAGRFEREEKEPMIRRDLVERIRREIAAGSYDTPQRWEAALDRLLERLQRD